MSSFRKRTVQKPIPGTRTSPQSGQIITSTGNPSLDALLGGGLPIGSICLIEEDEYVTYSKVLAKYFLAEGVISGQTVFIGSLDDDPVNLLAKLPKPLTENEIESEKKGNKEADKSEDERESPEKSTNGLRIAWRYNDLPIVNSEPANTKIGHHFNLMELMDPIVLSMAEAITWNGERAVHDDEETEEEDEVHFAAHRIVSSFNNNSNIASSDEMAVDPPPPTHPQSEENAANGSDSTLINNSLDKTASTDGMDVETHKSEPESTLSCSSAEMAKADAPKKPGIFENPKYMSLLTELEPLLHDDKYFHGTMVLKGLCRIGITSLGSPLWFKEQRFGEDLLKFLTVLRAHVRSIVSVCFITMPMFLIAKYDETLVPKIRNLVDYSIELESFAGTEKETHPAFKQYNGLLHLRKISAVNALAAYMPETTDLAFKLRRKKFVIEKFHLPPDILDEAPEGSCSSMPKSCNTDAENPAKKINLSALDF